MSNRVWVGMMCRGLGVQSSLHPFVRGRKRRVRLYIIAFSAECGGVHAANRFVPRLEATSRSNSQSHSQTDDGQSEIGSSGFVIMENCAEVVVASSMFQVGMFVAMSRCGACLRFVSCRPYGKGSQIRRVSDIRDLFGMLAWCQGGMRRALCRHQVFHAMLQSSPMPLCPTRSGSLVVAFGSTIQQIGHSISGCGKHHACRVAFV
jgi:hypothetical protein